MKKRTKAENAAYSKKLRDKKKALKASLEAILKEKSVAPAVKMPLPHSVDTIAPAENQVLEPPGTFIKLTLSDNECAECTELNKELDRLLQIIKDREAESADLRKRLESVQAENLALRQALALFKEASATAKPAGEPEKAKSGATDKEQQSLYNKAIAEKINRFGRNTSIGCIR